MIILILFLSPFLQVQINGVWGTVCDDSFESVPEAVVACRSLGLTGGEAKRKGFFGAGTGPIHMDDVDCMGSEAHLGLCMFVSDSVNDMSTVNCQHDEDVGVICDPPATTTTTTPPPTTATAGPNPQTEITTDATTAAPTATNTTAAVAPRAVSQRTVLAALGAVGGVSLLAGCAGFLAWARRTKAASAQSAQLTQLTQLTQPQPQTQPLPALLLARKVSIVQVPSGKQVIPLEVSYADEISEAEMSSSFFIEPSSSYVVEEHVSHFH